MEQGLPGLSLVFRDASGKEKTINLDELFFQTAGAVFSEAYIRAALERARGDHALARKYAGLGAHIFRKYVKRYKLREEFPFFRSFQFSLDIPEEHFLPFTGTLDELEDHYVIQKVQEHAGDVAAAINALKCNRRDGVPMRVWNRAQRREDYKTIADEVEQAPFPFSGTLAELRNHYVRQVLQKCGGNTREARTVLGISKASTFLTIMSTCGLVRRKMITRKATA